MTHQPISGEYDPRTQTWKCPKCKKSFASKKELRAHKKEIHAY